jgi:hypothetical protein
MKWTTFSIFCIFYLTLLLFADRRQAVAPVAHEFSAAYDLSRENTVLHAPSEVQANGWNAAQIPTERLVVPLIMIRSTATGKITMREVAGFEKAHGVIPPGALIVTTAAGASFDFESLRFLSEGRGAFGIGGIGRVDFVSNAPFIAAKGMYVIENLQLPEKVASGAIVTVAPEKSNANVAPVRLIALERTAQ